MGDTAVGAQSGSNDPEGESSGETSAPRDHRPAQWKGDADSVTEDSGEGGRGRVKTRKPRSFWKELPLLVGIALILALFIKTFLLQAFSIPSNSMQDTLQVGDRVLVDKLTPWFGGEPERGEVVVFSDPGRWLPEKETEQTALQSFFSFIGLMPSADEKDLIKRVIGVGGDTVACEKGGPVTVNGKALDEPYLYPGDTPCDDKPFGPVKVSEGHMWVMGDHRADSLDSRYHQRDGSAMVPVDKAVGRAVVVAWPLDRWTSLPVPDTFEQNDLASNMAAAAPGALGMAGAVPIVLRRRKRKSVVGHGHQGTTAARAASSKG